MIPGYKNNPQWRMYFDMKRSHRMERVEAMRRQREGETQLEALDAAAREFTERLANREMNNNEPRH